MTYALQDRLDHVGKRMKEINQTSITYHRGSVSSNPITASPIHIDPETLAQFGVALDVIRKDFVLDTEDLGLLPEPGDYIMEGSLRYDVVPLIEDMPSWSYTSSSKNRLRIHTELVPSS